MPIFGQLHALASDMAIDNRTMDWNEFSNSTFHNSSRGANDLENSLIVKGNLSKESMALKELEKNIHIIGLPIIIFVGVIGNLMSLAVFTGTQMRHQSSSVYLIFLNIVDIVFLLCLMVLWLAWIDVHLIHSNGWCQVTIYLTYVSGYLSVWAVVSYSVERFVVVFFPLQRKSWCTRKRALKVTLSLTAISILLYSFSLWTSGIDVAQGGSGSLCRWLPAYNHVLTVMIPMDSVITFAIPSTAIVILNISITIKIWEFVLRRRDRLCSYIECGKTRPRRPGSQNQIGLNTSLRRFNQLHRETNINENRVSNEFTGPALSSDSCRVNSSGRHCSQQLHTTKTLLLLSTVFVLLHTPSHAFRSYIIIHQLHSTNIQTTRAMKLSQNITQILFYANFASNFFLYCTFSKQFRNALTGALCGIKVAIQRRIAHCFMCSAKENSEFI